MARDASPASIVDVLLPFWCTHSRPQGDGRRQQRHQYWLKRLAIVGHDIGKWVKIGTQKEVPVRCFEHVHQARDLYKSWTTTKNHITNVYLGISLGVTISS